MMMGFCWPINRLIAKSNSSHPRELQRLFLTPAIHFHRSHPASRKTSFFTEFGPIFIRHPRLGAPAKRKMARNRGKPRESSVGHALSEAHRFVVLIASSPASH